MAETIKSLLNDLVDTGEPTFRVGTARDIDKDSDTCTVDLINDEAERLAVKLKPVTDGKGTGYIIYPVAGSQVVVGVIDGLRTHSFIAMATEVESIKLVIAGNKEAADKDLYQIDWKQFQFNSGSNKGLVKVVELTSQLNKIEQLINAFIAVYNSHTHAVATTPAGMAATPTTSSQAGTLTPTQQGQIENKNVTH